MKFVACLSVFLLGIFVSSTVYAGNIRSLDPPASKDDNTPSTLITPAEPSIEELAASVHDLKTQIKQRRDDPDFVRDAHLKLRILLDRMDDLRETQSSSLDDEATACASATVIPSLPYSAVGETVCGYGDNFDFFCWYYGFDGEDRVYRFDIAQDTCITATLSVPPESDDYLRLGLAAACPFENECIQDAIGGYQQTTLEMACVSLKAGTYYLIVDVGWSYSSADDYDLTIDYCECPLYRCCYGPDRLNRQCADLSYFDCSILEGTWSPNLSCSSSPCRTLEPGDNCDLPYTVQDEFNISPFSDELTNCGAGNDFEPDCLGSHTGGEDLVIEWTVTIGDDYTLSIYDYSYDEQPFGVAIYDQCPPNGNCIYSETAMFYYVSLDCDYWEAGVYYIVIDQPYSYPCIEEFYMSCRNCVNCNRLDHCGAPLETEYNNSCNNLDPLKISCDTEIYGAICPGGTDEDYYQIVVPVGETLLIHITDGEDCETWPPFCVRNYIYTDGCENPVGPNRNGWAIENTSSVPELYRIHLYSEPDSVPDCWSTYKIEGTCCEERNYCEDPIVLGNVRHYENTVNTCCAGTILNCVYEGDALGQCTGTCYPAGAEAVYEFTLDQSSTLNIQVGGCDAQFMIFTDCSNPGGTCVISQDREVQDPEVLTDIVLDAGTYYLATGCYNAQCNPVWVILDSSEPLPVELASFEAIPGDHSIELRWRTESETNVDRIELLRDNHLISLHQPCNTAVGQEYSWLDENLENDRLYNYSLVVVDIDGTREEVAAVSASPSRLSETVSDYSLYACYPNPFNSETTIVYDLPVSAEVDLKVFDIMGREITTLVSGVHSAGRHEVNFSANELPSGLYICRFESADFSAMTKMVLLK